MYSGKPTGSPGVFPQRGMWVFNGAQIRSDLSGATINHAELWLYCLASSSTSAGGVSIGWLNNSSIPGSYPGAGSDGTDYTGWPIPGWQSVDVTSKIGSDVVAGVLANSVMLTLDITLPDCTWAGFSSTNKPFLSITYTK